VLVGGRPAAATSLAALIGGRPAATMSLAALVDMHLAVVDMPQFYFAK
jgi:hypothetical protein